MHNAAREQEYIPFPGRDGTNRGAGEALKGFIGHMKEPPPFQNDDEPIAKVVDVGLCRIHVTPSPDGPRVPKWTRSQFC